MKNERLYEIQKEISENEKRNKELDFEFIEIVFNCKHYSFDSGACEGWCEIEKEEINIRQSCPSCDKYEKRNKI